MLNNFRQGIQTSKTFKLIVIGILSLLLLIPAMMIQDTIREREHRRNGVINEVSQKWGNAQQITGPYLSIPYEEVYTDGDEIKKTLKTAIFLPEDLEIKGNINPKSLTRSLYEVILYEGSFDVQASFKQLDFSQWSVDTSLIQWQNARICLGLTDMRGISERVILNVNGKKLEAEPGLPNNYLTNAGVSARTTLLPDEKINIDFKLNLNGSNQLSFIPLGKSSKVNLESTWPSPKFHGAFIPKTREVSDEGFKSSWQVLHLNRNYPQQWVGNAYNIYESAFSVELIQPVDQYQKAYRSVKYAFMFISLTFMVFFFAEMRNKLRIHPIQYLLVGLALVVFYTLLISLSEHISLNLSFLISAAATIALITGYAASIFKQRGFVISVGFALIALYTFLFTILQLEDYSLLMGSLGLFVIIALLMFASRKVSWYNDEKGEEEISKTALKE